VVSRTEFRPRVRSRPPSPWVQFAAPGPGSTPERQCRKHDPVRPTFCASATVVAPRPQPTSTIRPSALSVHVHAGSGGIERQRRRCASWRALDRSLQTCKLTNIMIAKWVRFVAAVAAGSWPVHRQAASTRLAASPDRSSQTGPYGSEQDFVRE
jgi:hypothetical protein